MNAEMELFRQIAAAADARFAQHLTDFAEQVKAPGLGDSNVFLATMLGAQTSILRMLKALDAAGLCDGQRQFEVLLRECANVWGQINDEPPTGGSKQ